MDRFIHYKDNQWINASLITKIDYPKGVREGYQNFPDGMIQDFLIFPIHYDSGWYTRHRIRKFRHKWVKCTEEQAIHDEKEIWIYTDGTRQVLRFPSKNDAARFYDDVIVNYRTRNMRPIEKSEWGGPWSDSL